MPPMGTTTVTSAHRRITPSASQREGPSRKGSILTPLPRIDYVAAGIAQQAALQRDKRGR